MDFNKVIDDRLAADTSFQDRIKSLSDDEKATETTKRRSEIANEEYAKASTIGNDQRQRAEKAEREYNEYKQKHPEAAPNDDKDKKPELTASDYYILQNRGVHPDDVSEVQRLAQIGKDGKPISVGEVLDDPTYAAIIASRVEKRKSAQAADTGGGRGGATTKSDSDIANDAMKGNKLPEKGSKEAEQLFNARHPRTGK